MNAFQKKVLYPETHFKWFFLLETGLELVRYKEFYFDSARILFYSTVKTWKIGHGKMILFSEHTLKWSCPMRFICLKNIYTGAFFK